jgi:hypothetical protein
MPILTRVFEHFGGNSSYNTFLTACYSVAKRGLTCPENFAGVIARRIFASSNETITNKQKQTK